MCMFVAQLRSAVPICYFTVYLVPSPLSSHFASKRQNTGQHIDFVSFDALTALCWSGQTNPVCFACATWLLFAAAATIVIADVV